MFEIETITQLVSVGTALKILPKTKEAIDEKLADSVKLVFNAPKYFTEYAKDMLVKINNKVYARLERTPPENIVQPPPYITVPALQAITYSIDSEELHNLFANLLASSMDKEKQSITHPAFVEIIKNMSPKDAKVLSTPELSNVDHFAICDAFASKKEGTHPFGYPFGTTNEGFYMLRNIVILNDDSISLDDISLSIVNFVRLGLIDINSQHFTRETLYQPFKDNFEQIKIAINVEEKLEMRRQTEEFSRGFSLIPKSAIWTPLGLGFIQTCVK